MSEKLNNMLIFELRTKLADVERERDNWRQIVREHCHADAEFRKEAGDLDQSDCYSGDSHTEILQRCKAQLAAAQARIKELEATSLTSGQNLDVVRWMVMCWWGMASHATRLMKPF
jgi:hypothetical protein